MAKFLEKSTPKTRRAMFLERELELLASEWPKSQFESMGSNPALTVGQLKMDVATPSQCFSGD